MLALLKRFFSRSVLPVWGILLLDTFIIAVACVFAIVLRYNLNFLVHRPISVLLCILVTIAVNLIFFRVFRTYSAVMRYSSFVDIMRIFSAQMLSTLLLLVVCILSNHVLHFLLIPIGIVLMTGAFSVILLVLLRILVKAFYDNMNLNRELLTRVFIYGAKSAGISIAESMRASLKNRYQLCGFLADEPELIGKNLLGKNVFAFDENVFEVLGEHSVHTIIVSPAKKDELMSSDKIDRLLERQIKILVAPPISEWDSLMLQPGQLKEVQIEDLLMRETIRIDLKKIAANLQGKRVLITGAAGSIGSEIMRQVASFNPYSLILVDQAETPLHDIRLELMEQWKEVEAVTIVADITNESRMEKIFREQRPQYIFHAAAYKHVPMMEDNVSEAIQNNVQGTRVLADLAVKYEVAKFVMVSTDKAVNPSNVMGCSKRICEIYVQSLSKKLQASGKARTQFVTTRFGNVLGSNGSVIPRFREQIAKGGPVTVTHPEIIRYFMTIPEACRLVLEAGSMGNGGEIYVFDMGSPVKIADLAKRMIQLSGRTNVKIQFTGLRHGEKLYEELLNLKENTLPTYNEKIMIAHVREYDYDEVKQQLSKLVQASYEYDEMAIVSIMKQMVPEFISLNSRFSELDQPEEEHG